MEQLKIAAVCMNSQPGEIDKNLEKIESFSWEASEKKVEIICFPELSITGYILKDPLQKISASLSQEIFERITGIARATGLVITAGTLEVLGGKKAYISQIVVGPRGIMGIYRKTHLSPDEKTFYQAGDTIEMFSYKDILFGVQLCYEAHFPELSTVMALRGAKLIIMPHASPRGTPEEKLESWMRHLPGRAFDNALFIVALNPVGKTEKSLSFPGVVVFLNPAGRILLSYTGNEERMVIAELKMDELLDVRGHRMRYFLPHRRPELYKEISSSSR
jgi:predicted amidohydrolase